MASEWQFNVCSECCESLGPFEFYGQQAALTTDESLTRVEPPIVSIPMGILYRTAFIAPEGSTPFEYTSVDIGWAVEIDPTNSGLYLAATVHTKCGYSSGDDNEYVWWVRSGVIDHPDAFEITETFIEPHNSEFGTDRPSQSFKEDWETGGETAYIAQQPADYIEDPENPGEYIDVSDPDLSNIFQFGVIDDHPEDPAEPIDPSPTEDFYASYEATKTLADDKDYVFRVSVTGVTGVEWVKITLSIPDATLGTVWLYCAKDQEAELGTESGSIITRLDPFTFEHEDAISYDETTGEPDEVESNETTFYTLDIRFSTGDISTGQNPTVKIQAVDGDGEDDYSGDWLDSFRINFVLFYEADFSTNASTDLAVVNATTVALIKQFLPRDFPIVEQRHANGFFPITFSDGSSGNYIFEERFHRGAYLDAATAVTPMQAANQGSGWFSPTEGLCNRFSNPAVPDSARWKAPTSYGNAISRGGGAVSSDGKRFGAFLLSYPSEPEWAGADIPVLADWEGVSVFVAGFPYPPLVYEGKHHGWNYYMEWNSDYPAKVKVVYGVENYWLTLQHDLLAASTYDNGPASAGLGGDGESRIFASIFVVPPNDWPNVFSVLSEANALHVRNPSWSVRTDIAFESVDPCKNGSGLPTGHPQYESDPPTYPDDYYGTRYNDVRYIAISTTENVRVTLGPIRSHRRDMIVANSDYIIREAPDYWSDVCAQDIPTDSRHYPCRVVAGSQAGTIWSKSITHDRLYMQTANNGPYRTSHGGNKDHFVTTCAVLKVERDFFDTNDMYGVWAAILHADSLGNRAHHIAVILWGETTYDVDTEDLGGGLSTGTEYVDEQTYGLDLVIDGTIVRSETITDEYMIGLRHHEETPVGLFGRVRMARDNSGNYYAYIFETLVWDEEDEEVRPIEPGDDFQNYIGFRLKCYVPGGTPYTNWYVDRYSDPPDFSEVDPSEWINNGPHVVDVSDTMVFVSFPGGQDYLPNDDEHYNKVCDDRFEDGWGSSYYWAFSHESDGDGNPKYSAWPGRKIEDGKQNTQSYFPIFEQQPSDEPPLMPPSGSQFAATRNHERVQYAPAASTYGEKVCTPPDP